MRNMVRKRDARDASFPSRATHVARGTCGKIVYAKVSVLRGRDWLYALRVAATNPDRSDWARWLQAQLDERGWIQAELVRRSAGAISRARVSRWLGGANPDLDAIRATCAALGVPAVEGMIAAGHLLPDDVGATVIQRPDPAGLTKRELLAELDRRLPDDAEVADAGVTPLRPVLRPDTIGEQWAARRFPPRK